MRPSPPPADTGPSPRALRAALIGTGAIAREHLSTLLTLPGVRVAGVCDLSPIRAEATAHRYGVPRWYTDPRAMLREVQPDLVHITTPPASHFSLAAMCLSAGTSTLVEKPITTSLSQWTALRALAPPGGPWLLENQNCRFNAPIQRMLALRDSGALGTLVDVDIRVQLDLTAPGGKFADANLPHGCADLPGGAIADFLPHLAYLAHAFVGPAQDVQSAWQLAAPPLGASELRAIVRGDAGLAVLSFSARAQPSGFWVRVAGTHLECETNLFEPPRMIVRRVRPGVAALSTLRSGLEEGRDVLWATVAGFWRKLGGVSSYDGLAVLLARTYEALRRGEPPPISLQQLDEVARLVAALSQGAAQESTRVAERSRAQVTPIAASVDVNATRGAADNRTKERAEVPT